MASAALINEIIQACQGRGELQADAISDGFHTFKELYDHRIALFIALCGTLWSMGYQNLLWKSRMNNDGTTWPGWFIAGIHKDSGKQITYHLPESKWDALHVQELAKAPAFDGHTSNDVLKRLADL
jgi:hypothetical protein